MIATFLIFLLVIQNLSTESFPFFQLNQGLDNLKSASFSSHNRMNHIIQVSIEYNEKLDKYLKDNFKHTSFTKE